MIATHRTSPYLAEALASLREQTYPTWRLILVDDGSGAPEEIDELARAIPGATVIHQANAGVSAARNRAIRAGEGEVVAFLDDDDRWPPDRLEQLVRALDRRPDALGAFGNGVYIDQDGRPFGELAHGVPRRRRRSSAATRPSRESRPWSSSETRSGAAASSTSEFTLAEDDEFILRLLRHGADGLDRRRSWRSTAGTTGTRRWSTGAYGIGPAGRRSGTNIDDALARGESDHVHCCGGTSAGTTSMTARQRRSGARSVTSRSRRFRAAAADAWDSLRIAPGRLRERSCADLSRRTPGSGLLVPEVRQHSAVVYASSPAVSGYGRVGRISKIAAASHLSMTPAEQTNTSPSSARAGA